MKYSRTMLLLVASLLLFGCGKAPVSLTPANLAGLYKGTYSNGATESFIFKPDGTFSQTLTQSNQVVYSNEGRWEIATNYSDSILLHSVLLAVDVSKINQGRPQRVDVYSAHWNRRVPGIVFSDEEHFWVNKQDAGTAQQHP
jgi:hypothetical protein